ncbi:MAG: 5-bromo-4-chloroindolyl phosphate hydrolysis family protein [Lachnospiraceae bacterium]|nr:5-bromo-4-chloroindolyl phosphate hydrolysis family protein [Lachnospiraceae bacterium]
MSGNNGSGFGWLIGIGAALLIASLLGGAGALLVTGGVVLAALLAMVVIAVVFAFKDNGETSSGKNKTPLTDEQAQTLSEARHELTELRILNARIDNLAIRNKSNEICAIMEKVLTALREEPSRISNAQMFLQYYLPTQKNILKKYEQIEESGLNVKELSRKVLTHLTDIRTATEKQLENLYEDDMFDISAEMELMNTSCKEDGLL